MKHKLTVGSLFAGIGGFELGFESTGRFETLWQVERDKYASRVLAKHWPNVRRHDDVCTWPNETTEPVDVLLAGFPCQDISYAGKGAGLNGKRSGLFYEVMRIVREMGPRFVVLENVSALLTRGMGDVLGSLCSLGFDAEWEIVSAESVGARHRRDRVFIIGWNTDGEHVKAVGGVQERQVADSGGSGGNLADSLSAGTRDQNGTTRRQKRESADASEPATLRQRDRETMPKRIDASGGDTRDVSDSDSERGRKNVERDTIPSGSARSGFFNAEKRTRDVSDSGVEQRERLSEKTVCGERTLSRESRRGISDEREVAPTLGALGRVADGFSLWLDEPRIGRTAVGMVKRADRLRCLGNAIVPQVAQVVAERLLEIHEANA